MFANIFILLTIVIAGLAFIDLLLSDQQKKIISFATIRIWHWFDEKQKYLRTGIFRKSELARKRVVAIWVVSILLVSAFAAYEFVSPIRSPTAYFILMTLAVVVALLFIPALGLLSRLIQRDLLYFAVLIAVVIAAYKVADILLWKGFLLFLLDDFLSNGGENFVRPFVEPRNPYVVANKLLLEVIGLVIGLLAAYLVGGFIFIYLSLFAFAYLVMGVLATVEFLLRRLAETPRGPLIGVAVICGIISAVIKIFAE